MPERVNTGLARLLAESGWSQRQFAQAVNRLGTERDTPLRYREPSVNQWLGGTVPRPEVRPLLLEAFARRLQRPVTYLDVGFPKPEGEDDASPSTVEELLDLGRLDMDPSRRSVLGAGLFSVALTVPGWQDLVGRAEAISSTPKMTVGMGEVRAVETMTNRLSDLDDDFGGRYARPMAAAFLVNTVAPYLNANSSEETRRKMASAAATLCYTTGWMAVDEGLHGLAQSYYVKALELAGAGGDHMTYCHVLRGMSVQAADLGHGVPATRLASAAWEASPESSPRMRAFLSGQLAHSYALAGERNNALVALRDTERAVNQAESKIGTFGGFSSATLAYATAQVRYAFGDVKGSVESLKDHFRLRDASDRQRSGLIFGSLLAERQLKIGHLEAACETWDGILDSYPGMHSGRVDQKVREIEMLTRPYQRNAYVRQLRERVREIKTPR